MTTSCPYEYRGGRGQTGGAAIPSKIGPYREQGGGAEDGVVL